MGSDSGPGQEETKDSGPPMQQSASGQDESEPMVIDGANSVGQGGMGRVRTGTGAKVNAEWPSASTGATVADLKLAVSPRCRHPQEGPTAMEVSQPPASGEGGGEEGATAKPPEKNVRNYFRAVHNDGTPENNMLLMMLKNIFAKQVRRPRRRRH